MNDTELDFLINEIHELVQDAPQEKAPQVRPNLGRRIWGIIGKVLLVILETVLLLAVSLYGVMFVLAKGPSPTARNLFLLSVKETSAVGFLANLFYTDAEIEEMISGNGETEFKETDTSLIEIPTPKPPDDGQDPTPDEWGLIDEDGDGIILDHVRGEGFNGYMLVILDPSRVIMGSVPADFGSRGYTVDKMAQKYGAVAGINAGGFYDPNGKGNGSIPDTMVVFDGQIYYPEFGCSDGFVGIDSNHILHVGRFTAQQIKDKNIQYGVGFGPVLVINGEPVDNYASGVNPRTAIGQRSDGAILMLVIDGRQVNSLGATYNDMTDVFLSYGAVNACNLDGGSSSVMWLGDQYINSSASLIGVRPVPTTFLVLPKEVQGDD